MWITSIQNVEKLKDNILNIFLIFYQKLGFDI